MVHSRFELRDDESAPTTDFAILCFLWRAFNSQSWAGKYFLYFYFKWVRKKRVCEEGSRAFSVIFSCVIAVRVDNRWWPRWLWVMSPLVSLWWLLLHYVLTAITAKKGISFKKGERKTNRHRKISRQKFVIFDVKNTAFHCTTPSVLFRRSSYLTGKIMKKGKNEGWLERLSLISGRAQWCFFVGQWIASAFDARRPRYYANDCTSSSRNHCKGHLSTDDNNCSDRWTGEGNEKKHRTGNESNHEKKKRKKRNFKFFAILGRSFLKTRVFFVHFFFVCLFYAAVFVFGPTSLKIQWQICRLFDLQPVGHGRPVTLSRTAESNEKQRPNKRTNNTKNDVIIISKVDVAWLFVFFFAKGLAAILCFFSLPTDWQKGHDKWFQVQSLCSPVSQLFPIVLCPNH